MLSGIAAATLDGTLAVPRGETVIVASSFEQARIAFEHVLAFMGDKLADKRRWKIWDTAQQARIEDRVTGARVRCIGSDPRRAHGLAPVLVLADEPAQWPESTGERMVAALRTAAGKQPHSRFVALGTRPADPEHWFTKLLAGGADYAQCHAAKPVRDGVDNLYRECARRGELLMLGQRSVDIPALLQAALERLGRPSRVVADRWREAELRDALEAAGVPPAAFEARGMGYQDGAADVRAFRKACADGWVTPAPSLLLRSAMAEARTVSDPAGNSKLSKGSQGGRRLRARDDAAAAAILAVAAGVRQLLPARLRRAWRYSGMAG